MNFHQNFNRNIETIKGGKIEYLDLKKIHIRDEEFFVSRKNTIGDKISKFKNRSIDILYIEIEETMNGKQKQNRSKYPRIVGQCQRI